MSLPLAAVDRLFDRLIATYGRDFTGRYEGVNLNAVKSSWSHELSGFASRLEMIAWALENLPEKAPNVIEFRALARKAPAPETPRLPEPKADPERVKTELAKLGGLKAEIAGGGGHFLDWARRIVARKQNGDKNLTRTQIEMAEDALRRKGAL